MQAACRLGNHLASGAKLSIVGQRVAHQIIRRSAIRVIDEARIRVSVLTCLIRLRGTTGANLAGSPEVNYSWPVWLARTQGGACARVCLASPSSSRYRRELVAARFLSAGWRRRHQEQDH
jgi:hypothetical protein